ncbi:sodium channel and clathrin linker 1-like [Diadema antillarum]|uniref:sodium channel and clathrin linker 1-like n=1 Tax=Diadema antillarum TaxID=105358 RepID=UPI003A86B150
MGALPKMPTQAELHDLRGKVDRLVLENDSLREELKTAVEGQLAAVQTGLGEQAEELAERELIDNMRRQIELLEKERQTANDMWQETVKELDRLAADHREVLGTSKAQASTHQAIQTRGVALMKDNQQLTENIYKLETANRHLQEVASTQERELSGLRDQLRTVKTDLRTTSIQLNDFTSMKNKLEDQLQSKDKELGEVRSRAQSAETRIPGLQDRVKEMEHQLELMGQEAQRLQGAKRELEDRVKALHQRCTDAETREYEATVQVRESIQMAENSLLEKDQALIREQQRAEEVKRLQEALGNLVNEAGRRTRQEVVGVRKQCNANMEKLMEEIQALETENAEKQAEIDRAIREKRAVEHELEQVYKEGTATTGDQRLNELQNRVIALERLKDEATLRAQQLEKEIQRQERNHEEEKTRSLLVSDQLRDRLEKLSRECTSVSEEKLRLTEDMDALQKRMLGMRRERDEAERMSAKEILGLQQEMDLLRTEYAARLEGAEESGRQSSRELRQMLASQQRMSAKWKEECKVLGQKFEAKSKELRSQLAVHKKRNEDLNNQMTQLKEHRLLTEQELANQVDLNRKMRQKVEASEQQATEVTKKLAERSSKERRLVHDKKQLQAQLDKLRSEFTGSNR